MKRIMRISKDGKITMLHADGPDFERMGDVKIERATDVSYKTGKGWSAKCIHTAYSPPGHTEYRKNRKEAIRDEEMLLNRAILDGTINANSL